MHDCTLDVAAFDALELPFQLRSGQRTVGLFAMIDLQIADILPCAPGRASRIIVRASKSGLLEVLVSGFVLELTSRSVHTQSGSWVEQFSVGAAWLRCLLVAHLRSTSMPWKHRLLARVIENVTITLDDGLHIVIDGIDGTSRVLVLHGESNEMCSSAIRKLIL